MFLLYVSVLLPVGVIKDNNNGVGRVDKVQQASSTRRKKSQLFMLYGRLVHVGETLTDLPILGCKLHKNAFGGRTLPGPAGGAIALPQTH